LWCGRYTERTKEEREKLMEVLVGLMRENKVRIVINAKFQILTWAFGIAERT
jgi:hypothetical protein